MKQTTKKDELVYFEPKLHDYLYSKDAINIAEDMIKTFGDRLYCCFSRKTQRVVLGLDKKDFALFKLKYGQIDIFKNQRIDKGRLANKRTNINFKNQESNRTLSCTKLLRGVRRICPDYYRKHQVKPNLEIDADFELLKDYGPLHYKLYMMHRCIKFNDVLEGCSFSL